MLALPDRWVWDTWFAHDGERHHALHLQAPRALGDPDLRHRNASIGHAVGDDLLAWTPTGTVVEPSPAPAFDDLATWTGCVVHDGERWHLITTGLSRVDDGRVQRIAARTATSPAGPWSAPGPVLEADPRWYAVLGVHDGAVETHWRDPWVARGDDGRWHLHATARAAGPAPAPGTGAVIAHAVSDDLRTWEVRPPLTPASRRFGWAEVVSMARIAGRWWLTFSCLGDQLAPTGAQAVDDPDAGGTWIVACDGPGRPVDLDAAVRLSTGRLYVARPVALGGADADDPDDWRVLGFVNRDDDGRFGGVLSDPLRLDLAPDGVLALVDAPAAWRPTERPAPAGRRVLAPDLSIHDGSSGTYLPVEEN